MRGLKLNPTMLAAGAVFSREATTASDYQIWTINDEHPAMQHVTTGGVSVALELWRVPPKGLGTILQQEPPGLCIGKVKLEDGSNHPSECVAAPDLPEPVFAPEPKSDDFDSPDLDIHWQSVHVPIRA
jgi:hypothetical protein